MIPKVNIVLVDDHKLLRNGLAGLIESFNNYTVCYEANNGLEMIDQFKTRPLPDIVR